MYSLLAMAKPALAKLPTHAAGGLQAAWMQTVISLQMFLLLSFPASYGCFLATFHSLLCFYNPGLLIYSD